MTTNAWAIPQWDGRRFAAALFDLDGVLTPTAEVHMKAWHRMFTDYFTKHDITPPYTDADYFTYVDGKPRYDGVRACLASRGVQLPEGSPDDAAGTETICGVGNIKNDAFERILHEEGVEAYPGSVQLMDHLEPLGVAMAVVSSSRNAPAVLEAAGLAHRFEVVVDGNVGAQEGIAGKPAPDMFSLAATRLGVADSDSVVVEDALSGVQAGAAGAFGLVVGVDRGAGVNALMDNGAQVVVEDLKELIVQ
ncbi:MAG: beta-phosphoglucomutase family hydrolase [Demequina sp.]